MRDALNLTIQQLSARVAELEAALAQAQAAEDRLTETEERFRIMADTAPVMIWMSGTDKLCDFFNSGWLKFTGRTMEQETGNGWAEGVHPDDFERCLSIYTTAFDARQPFRMEYRLRRRDGEYRWILDEAAPRFHKNGTFAGYIGSCIDISDHRRIEAELQAHQDHLEELVEQRTIELIRANEEFEQANERLEEEIACRWKVEMALRESETKYRTLFEASSEAFFLMTGAFIDCNEQACRVLQCSREEILGKSPLAFSPVLQPDGRPSAEKAREFQTRAIAGESLAFEWQHCLPDGKPIDTEISLKAVRVGGKSIIQAIMRDITERKRTEAELRQYAAALEDANRSLEEFNALAEAATRAKSEFLANMSHEIRTPMTAILGFAEILATGVTQPEHREAIETIQRNGDYLLRLINDILDLSKIESGKLAVERCVCSPLELVSDCVALMRVRAEAKNLSLQADFRGPIPQAICTDPIRLRQILVNLLGNAIKFTEVGGVRLVVGLDAEQPGKLHFEVTDTGIGMTSQQASRLFQPFSQADASIGRRFGGTGLGLAISKRLVEMLGGTISVSSEAGRGSVFCFSLDPGPLAGVTLVNQSDEQAWRQPKEKPQEPLPRLDCKVLLAEDGPDNRRLLGFLLRKAGAIVTTVENGQLAVETVLDGNSNAGGFDVILMDMLMPVLDGYEATAKLRASGYCGPIIALTAHAMVEDRQKCLDAGCDDYLSKPVDRRALLETVAKYAQAVESKQAAAADFATAHP